MNEPGTPGCKSAFKWVVKFITEISDAALVELALRACSTVQEVMNIELLQAVRAFVRQNKYATVPILTAPLDPLSDAKIQSPHRL